MSDRKKSGLPVLWPMWLIVFFLFNIPVYLFVIVLALNDWSWENALTVTKMDRMISLMALGLMVFAFWYLIGLTRLLQRTWKELDLN